jgi:alpha-L-fucosidase
MKRGKVLNFVLLFSCFVCVWMLRGNPGQNTQKTMSNGPSQNYDPDWPSLYEHVEAPEWFRDAKFGIYFHWGVYSVPAFGSEWYPRNMFRKDSKVYEHHLSTYGDPAEFGYHDFIPEFKAERFDAKEWAALFKKAGARFAGPVAEHHDGFSMWASKLNPWNAKDKGPKRDIVGEMEKAIRRQGLRFFTSFHHAFNNQYPIEGFPTGYYPHVESWPTASENPELRLLYGNLPREEFLDLWKGKLYEVIDGYQPDIIWFDFVLGDIPEDVRKEFLAYYFNRADAWGTEVVVTYKQNDLPREVGVEDFEKGRLDHLTDYTWLTDDTLSWGSWCYTQDLEIKSAKIVLHTLIDIVSKNGVLLLNISPRADGVIPANQREVLSEIGDWLDTNGEAIYDTRPWKNFGEGPTRMEKEGDFAGRLDYTPQDIRFTRSKDGQTFYAITLGLPKAVIVLKTVKVNSFTDNAQIRILGHKEKVGFTLSNTRELIIEPPDLSGRRSNLKYAVVFKLTGFELDIQPE